MGMRLGISVLIIELHALGTVRMLERNSSPHYPRSTVVLPGNKASFKNNHDLYVIPGGYVNNQFTDLITCP